MKLIGDLERVVRGKCGDLGGVVAEMTLLVCPRSISQSSICIVEYGVEYCKNISVALVILLYPTRMLMLNRFITRNQMTTHRKCAASQCRNESRLLNT